MPILVYIDNDISFKYNENWIKKSIILMIHFLFLLCIII